MYVLKDPWGKTVGKYKIFKNLLKKGYELYGSKYSSYTVYSVSGSYNDLIGEIRYNSDGFDGIYFRYAGKDYVIWADGSTDWYNSDPDPYRLLDEHKLKSRTKYRKRI